MKKPMTQAELDALIKNQPCHLKRTNEPKKLKLVGYDLTGLSFEHAHITDATIRECNLSGCSFVGATLKNCNLSMSFFFEADLTNSILSLCRGSRTGFKKAKFDGAVLSVCKFGSATFEGADFRRTQRISQTVMNPEGAIFGEVVEPEKLASGWGWYGEGADGITGAPETEEVPEAPEATETPHNTLKDAAMTINLTDGKLSVVLNHPELTKLLEAACSLETPMTLEIAGMKFERIDV